jgi:hypothetical protein
MRPLETDRSVCRISNRFHQSLTFLFVQKLMKNERKFDRRAEDGRAAGKKDGNPSVRAATLNGHEHDGETIVALGPTV